MTVNENIDLEDEDETKGCGVCPICTLAARVGAMQDVVNTLRRELEETEALLLAAVSGAETCPAEGCDDEDEDEFGLADAVPAGRA